jgi:hypothetical protein
MHRKHSSCNKHPSFSFLNARTRPNNLFSLPLLSYIIAYLQVLPRQITASIIGVDSRLHISSDACFEGILPELQREIHLSANNTNFGGSTFSSTRASSFIVRWNMVNDSPIPFHGSCFYGAFCIIQRVVLHGIAS